LTLFPQSSVLIAQSFITPHSSRPLTFPSVFPPSAAVLVHAACAAARAAARGYSDDPPAQRNGSAPPCSPSSAAQRSATERAPAPFSRPPASRQEAREPNSPALRISDPSWPPTRFPWETSPRNS